MVTHARARRGGSPAREIRFNEIMRALRVVGVIEDYGWNQATVRKKLRKRIKDGKIEQLGPRGPYRGKWRVEP
jgi:hypothetical protein